MKTKLNFLLLVALAGFSLSGKALALDLGNQITISDNNVTAGAWYSNTLTDDHEVEPGMAGNQGWDLEGFFLKGSMLSLSGGYNFKDGKDRYMSGDIFIDVNGDAKYGNIDRVDPSGNGNKLTTNTSGYDYVFDLDYSNNSYVVFSLTPESEVYTSYYAQNGGSDPWTYVSGGTEITSAAGFFALYSGLDDDAIIGSSFSGGAGSHYALQGFNLSFLDPGTDFISHFTMQCGNDNLMGMGTTPVPEPSTLVLLCSGLIGLVFLNRRRKNI